jgi:RNA polymerase sigma factor (sigma-70 family)
VLASLDEPIYTQESFPSCAGWRVPNGASMAEELSLVLVERWRAGDQQAATELFHRYAERLLRLAHQRLSGKLAQRVAAEDVVQSAYCSFFIGARNGRYVLERSGQLWQLLVAITLHKVHTQARRHSAGKRALDQETSAGFPPLDAALLCEEPTPDEAAVLTDTLEHVLRQLEPFQRRTFELRLQGYGIGEIAAEVRCSRPTVRRALDCAQRVLEQLGSAGVEVR